MGDLTKNPAYQNTMQVIPTTTIQTIKVDSAPIDKAFITWTQNLVIGNWILNANNGFSNSVVRGFVSVNGVRANSVNNIPTVVTTVETYYIGDHGVMVTGWVNTVDSKTYYFETAKTSDEGKMVIDWKVINNNWYYFGLDGAMNREAIIPDGYRVGKDGRWFS